ncbi:MAG: copper chaperone PCu(A)C [Phaeovulum sp.]|uniref:copper chaperone PCu(A)C n=1 Tax=Phaeovulum sp. TaxID=2934796 RepID=UPI0027323C04|nr:copper chaperone PCu(A)C [Phaeovulum sp.]MDP3861706.1 copper chaperone PCu(A)C [Phaeovulum sp.]
MFALKALLVVSAAAFALPASAEIRIVNPYMIASPVTGGSGAAFFVVENTGPGDDRLADASSTISDMTQLHTHIANAAGVMQMVHAPEGWVIPAGTTLALARGSHHVMFMGMKAPLKVGDMVALTLKFETAGDIVVEIPYGVAPAVDAMPMDAMPMGNMPMTPPAKP